MKTKVVKRIGHIVIALLCLSGCDRENDIKYNELGSSISVVGDFKMSSFVIPNEGLGILNENEQLHLHLTSLTNAETVIFDGKIKKMDIPNLHCVMMIPLKEMLADGDYLLKISKERTSRAEDMVFMNMQFLITMKDEMLFKILRSDFAYNGLEGPGSANQPYEIGSTEAFEIFFYSLGLDPNHGKGRYFIQTADFNGPQQGDGIDGRGFANQIFAGTYDGGGHKITFSYQGAKNAGKDNAVGLFKKLADGAAIKNLNLLADFEQVCDTIGVVAAWAEGNIVLDKVNVVTGSNIINAGNMVGGLIGLMNDGILHVNNSSSIAKIDDAGNDVGGLIGKADKVKLELGSTIISEGFKHLKGKNQVGGLVGSLKGAFAINTVTLKHTVPEEDKDLKILEGTGNNVGGLIGSVTMTAPCSLYSATIAMPVNGVDNVGGLFGQIEGGGNKLTIDYCYVRKDGNRVQGSKNVGGYIGSAKAGIVFSGMENWQSAHVTGIYNVGGFFGEFDNNDLTIDVAMHMTGNIKCMESGATNIGGFAGYLKTKSIELGNKFDFSSTMEIYGYMNVGGFAGLCENATISGLASVKFNDKTVVDPNMLSMVTPNFQGIINNIDPFKSKALYVGGFIGYAKNTTIKSIYTKANVFGSTFVGGIVGMADESSMTGCASKSIVVGGVNTGGIAGDLAITGSQKCDQNINYSEVSGTASVGGIFGTLTRAGVSIDKNVNLGNVTGLSNVGGIAGSSDATIKTITQSANYGTISASSPVEDSGVGGIVGHAGEKMTIRSCANHGDVKLTNTTSSHKSAIGGILGSGGVGAIEWNADNQVKVLECCNTGTVSVLSYSNENYMGGIAGMFQAGTIGSENMVVKNCCNSGKVSGKSKYDNGGIIGLMNNCTYAERSFNIGKVEHGNGGAGCRTHVTDAIHTDYLYVIEGSSSKHWSGKEIVYPASMKGDKSFYPGLDFNTIWKIDDAYPYLQNCYFQFAKL